MAHKKKAHKKEEHAKKGMMEPMAHEKGKSSLKSMKNHKGMARGK
jgi:hypothetical protein